MLIDDSLAFLEQFLANVAWFALAVALVFSASRLLAMALSDGLARDVVAFPSELGLFIVRAARDPLVPRRAWCCLALGITFCTWPSNASIAIPAREAIELVVATVALHVTVSMFPPSTRRGACRTTNELLAKYLRLA
jgi:hypothetical protein